MSDLLKYALLAQQCYSDKPTIGIEDSASRAVVYGDTVAIPGTNNVLAAIADMKFDTVVTILGELHLGFWESYNAIRTTLLKLRPHFITGHSLGSAIGIYYAAELCLLGHPPKAVYCYESPRTATDLVIARILSANNVQLTITHNGHDIIPTVPAVVADWKQQALPIELCATDYPYPHRSPDLIKNIEDHLMANVIMSIQNQEHD